jgi:hypothetical protein
MNPYGAVPAALEQTRLTLRDIMAGYVNQKIQESKLNLAQKQMEVEARALELEGEKQKAQTEFNLARIAADTARQDKSYDLEQEKFGHSQEMDRLRLPLVQKQIETAGVQAQTEKERLGQEKLKTQQMVDLSQKKPWSAWADEAGLTEAQKEIFLDQYATGDGAVAGTTVARALQNLNSEKPLLYAVTMAGNIDKIKDLDERLRSDVNLTAPEKTALTTERDRLMKQSEYLQLALNAMREKKDLSVKDYDTLKENATDAWDILADDARASYAGGYRQFEKEYIDYFKQEVNQGIDQLAALRKKSTEKPAGEKPPTAEPTPKTAAPKPLTQLSTADTKLMVDKLNEIEREVGADAAAKAKDAVMGFIRAGDLQAARDYLDNLLRPAQAEIGNRLFRRETREPAGTAGQGGIVRMPIPKVKR